MSDSTERIVHTARGYVATLTIRNVLDDHGPTRADVEVDLIDGWERPGAVTSLRFIDARDIRYGSDRDGIRLGVQLVLSVVDISEAGWSTVKYKVANLEQDCPLSLYCREFEVSSKAQPADAAD